MAQSSPMSSQIAELSGHVLHKSVASGEAKTILSLSIKKEWIHSSVGMSGHLIIPLL
jgi:hypothetical protein